MCEAMESRIMLSAVSTATSSLPVWVGSTSAATWDASAQTLTVTGSATITANPANSSAVPNISIDTGGDLVLNASATIGCLSLQSGAKLDITNNTLLINYGTGSSPLAAVQADVADGAIISSTANAGNPGQYTVGYADSTEINSIPTGNVEVMYTLAGDANLDGRVNFNDYSILQNNYDSSGADWSQGDFNHDGIVNFNDYSRLQNNYDQVLKTAPPLTWATPTTITYGTALSGTQLDASANVSGTFAYSPAIGTVLSAGTHVLSTTFTPTDTTDYCASTDSVNLMVNQASTTNAVASSNGSSQYGQSVTFTATVTPTSGSGETGSVQFQIDGGNVGSAVTLNNDSASYTTSSLSAGSHSIAAVYNGDGNFTASTSPAITQSVGLASVTYTLSINDDGTDHYCAGCYAVYASDSNYNGGLASFEVNVDGYATINNVAPEATDFSGTYSPVGFNEYRATTPSPEGSQDTIDALNGQTSVLMVYGIGQTAGNLASVLASGGGAIAIIASTQPVYGAPVELITGTFSSGMPSLTNTAKDIGNVFVTNSGANTEAATLAFNTVTLVSSSVSQSTAVASTAATPSSTVNPIYSVYSPATQGIFNTADPSDALAGQDVSS